jgi:hypothetical protein
MTDDLGHFSFWAYRSRKPQNEGKNWQNHQAYAALLIKSQVINNQLVVFLFDQFEFSENKMRCTNGRTGVKYCILRRFKKWQGCQDF